MTDTKILGQCIFLFVPHRLHARTFCQPRKRLCPGSRRGSDAAEGDRVIPWLCGELSALTGDRSPSRLGFSPLLAPAAACLGPVPDPGERQGQGRSRSQRPCHRLLFFRKACTCIPLESHKGKHRITLKHNMKVLFFLSEKGGSQAQTP